MIEFEGRKIPDRVEEIVEPARSLLLVWDMQYDIAARAFNFDLIVASLKSLIAAARKARVPVAYSQQTAIDFKHEAPVWIRRRMAKVSDPKNLPLRTVEGTRGWQVLDELKPEAGDIVFKKRRPSAFIGTDFDLLLRSRGVETVILTGVSTEGGIEGTARQGLNLGYAMVVVRDAVGSSDREAHELALKYMESVFDVVDSKELCSIWGSPR